MSIQLPAKDSAVARAFRVLAYQVAAIVVAFLLDPNVVKGVAEYYPQVAWVLVFGAPVLSAIYNFLRSDVPNK